MSTEAMDRIRAELIKKIRQTGVVPDDFVVPLVDGYETVIAQVSALTAENERLRDEIEKIKGNRIISAIFGHHKGAPRPFGLYRREDVSGVSGTGLVALGCEFEDGLVVLRWNSAWPTSVVFHERGIESVKAIHGHDGRTEVVWLSDEFESLAEVEEQRDEALRALSSLRELESAARAWVAEAYARGVDPAEEHALTAALITAVDALPPTPPATEGSDDTA